MPAINFLIRKLNNMAQITKRGKKWRVTVSASKYGNNARITKSFDNKEDAKKWALENELAKNIGIDLSKRNQTFSKYFENWVKSVKKNDVRETTYQNYLHVIPIVKKLFGDTKISALDDLLVQSKIDEYAENHSRKTTTEVLLKIRTALSYAYGHGLLATDFGKLVKTRGKVSEKKNIALSITEMKILRQYLIRAHKNEFEIMVLLALETGARRGELLGLRPEYIEDNAILIRESISPTSKDTELKTKKSRRKITINHDVMELLKTVPCKENGYIFDPDGFQQSAKLSRLLNRLGLSKTTFHGLRDTHASFLFSSDKISIDYISQRLGHSNIQTTMNYYLTLMPEKKHQQDADALDFLNSLSE